MSMGGENHSFTEEEIQAAFDLVDTDHSNTIEFEELNSYFSKINGIPEFLNAVDVESIITSETHQEEEVKQTKMTQSKQEPNKNPEIQSDGNIPQNPIIQQQQMYYQQPPPNYYQQPMYYPNPYMNQQQPIFPTGFGMGRSNQSGQGMFDNFVMKNLAKGMTGTENTEATRNPKNQ